MAVVLEGGSPKVVIRGRWRNNDKSEVSLLALLFLVALVFETVVGIAAATDGREAFAATSRSTNYVSGPCSTTRKNCAD